jgi:hypothetical protein
VKTPLAMVRAWLAPRSRSTLSPTEHTGTAAVAGTSRDKGRASAVYQVPAEHDRLLERASVAWHLGDWDTLTRLDIDGISHSPYRARIALFIGSAFLQTDKPSDASRLFQHAMEWGCDPQSMSEILMAGAHHNVGRAALLLGDKVQEQEHVLRSSAIGWTASPNAAVAAARAEATRHEFTRAGLDSPTAPALPAVAASGTASSARKPLSVEPAQLKQELDRLKSQLVQEVKAAAENTAKQLEAFLSIQHYLQSGELLGEMHGWPISPDIGMYLIRRVELGAYDVLLEFGSGVSTLLMAKAAMNIRARGGKAPVHVVFEHLEEYYFQTAALLESGGVRQATQLELTPLEPYFAPGGVAFQFYGCSSALGALRDESRSNNSQRILVVVDGPPGSTGPHARFPALPVVLSLFGDCEVDVLVDDYARKEEREIVEMWSSHLDKLGIAHYGTALRFEKGAYMLHIHRDGSRSGPESGD